MAYTKHRCGYCEREFYAPPNHFACRRCFGLHVRGTDARSAALELEATRWLKRKENTKRVAKARKP